jgi:phenylalanyl-tRNA synthetase beta chain
MKFSERWLRTFTDPDLSTQGLAHALTMAGLEVEEVTPAAPSFEGVVVGHVLSVEPHPNAQKLSVCSVDVGAANPLSIVCGAPNVSAGVKAPCATVGAKIPGMQISEAKLRGVQSQGMLCSAAELGISDDDASGLMLLDAGASTGTDIRQMLDLDDQIFSLKLTANRGDCLSMLGVAREVSAITGVELRMVETKTVKADITDRLEITLSAPEACPRYAGRILRGVNAAAPTPASIIRRLERSGVRSISAIVDLTNYVMLEFGQPMHAFDLAKLAGSIDVRFAKSGETLELLNGQTIDLEPDMLLICDDSGPVALAGIMGGEATAVTPQTTDIFLETAFFAPSVVAGKWRHLGFSTDASHRYERGVDYEGIARAYERLSELILEVCGGQAAVVNDVVASLPTRTEVKVRVPRVAKVLGMPVSAERIEEILERLEMQPRRTGDAFVTTPPSYRFDISIEEDLIEEVVRIEGYEKLPATLPHAASAMRAMPERVQDMSRIRQAMVARDYQEVVTYSFVDEAWEKDFGDDATPIRLANPIAEQLSVMRSTLLGSLVDTLKFNLNRRQTRVRLFEISRVFSQAGASFDQRRRLGAIAYGYARQEQWGVEAQHVDFYDLRGDLESLFSPREIELVAAQHPALHPGKSAQVLVNSRVVGWIGELHPGLRQRYEIPEAVVAFEVDTEAVAERPIPAFEAYSKYPIVRRDIAVEVADDIPVQTLLASLNKGRSSIVKDVAVFDLYRGKGIDSDKKGLAFRVLLQDTKKTLTDAGVDSAVAGLRDILEREHGAKLR